MYILSKISSFIDDIKLICNIINNTFGSFSNRETGDFDHQAYLAYSGLNHNVLSDFYCKCHIKKIIPFNLNEIECFIILSSLAPYYYPSTYIAAKYLLRNTDDAFSSIGGKILGDNNCFYPTCDTILFLLAGHDMLKRLKFTKFFSPGSKLFSNYFLEMGKRENVASQLSSQLIPMPELISILKGEQYKPEFNNDFPASRLETRMEWEDLVLPYETILSLEEIILWIRHGDLLFQYNEIDKRIKPGYRCLFYGPPGTGKTLTASLIGKTYGMPVYRIDLSMVVSKWIGETEKKLKGIFDLAMNKNWILFFDEADSLFGKRTSTNNSNDRYANQEVSYLLQRIEDYPGLIILASNLKNNIDDAFNRRFQSTIFFPMPDSEIRYIIWQKALPKEFPLEKNINLYHIAKQYEMSGGAIINVVRYCVLKALNRREDNTLLLEDFEYAIVREFKKEGKIIK